jgi:hypothetical protein
MDVLVIFSFVLGMADEYFQNIILVVLKKLNLLLIVMKSLR